MDTTTTTTEASTMTQVHITRVNSSGDVYGHDTGHCDANGCNGTEHYYPTLRGSVQEGDGGCVVGETVDEHD
jgi:hypothetical protein